MSISLSAMQCASKLLRARHHLGAVDSVFDVEFVEDPGHIASCLAAEPTVDRQNARQIVRFPPIPVISVVSVFDPLWTLAS